MSAPKPERVRQILEAFATGQDATILRILDPAKFEAKTFQHRYGMDIYMCNFGWPCALRRKATLLWKTQAIGKYGLKYHSPTCNLLPYQTVVNDCARLTAEGIKQSAENLLYYIDPIYHQLYLQILDEIELKKL